MKEEEYESSDYMKQAWDDVTGEELNQRGVSDARKEEVQGIRRFGVYTKVPIKESWDKTGRAPIKTRWIDINKGDKKNPELDPGSWRRIATTRRLRNCSLQLHL